MPRLEIMTRHSGDEHHEELDKVADAFGRAWTDGDWDAYLALYADDFVFECPVAALGTLSPAEQLDRIFFAPGCRTEPPATDPAAAVYARPTRAAPPLLDRLPGVSTPTLVLWGEGDGVVDVDYGAAYAAAIPGARFQVLPRTGHHGYVESPNLLVPLFWGFSLERV